MLPVCLERVANHLLELQAISISYGSWILMVPYDTNKCIEQDTYYIKLTNGAQFRFLAVAPGVPKRSPIQVLSLPSAAYLKYSNGSCCFQHGWPSDTLMCSLFASHRDLKRKSTHPITKMSANSGC